MKTIAWELLMCLIVGAFLFKYLWPLVLLGLLIWAAPTINRKTAAYWQRRDERRAAEAAAKSDLLARADRQHNWVMQGDPRGTYGTHPPKKTT